MAREKNEKVSEAEKLYHLGMKLVDIAQKLEVPAGTVRRWKSTYRWEDPKGQEKKKSERSETRHISRPKMCISQFP